MDSIMVHSACCNAHWLLFQNPINEIKAFACCAECGDIMSDSLRFMFGVDSDGNKIDEDPGCTTCGQAWEILYADGWKLMCPECNKISTVVVEGFDPTGDSGDDGECECPGCKANREEVIKNN